MLKKKILLYNKKTKSFQNFSSFIIYEERGNVD